MKIPQKIHGRGERGRRTAWCNTTEGDGYREMKALIHCRDTRRKQLEEEDDKDEKVVQFLSRHSVCVKTQNKNYSKHRT